jgi:hypothetical protein
VAWLAISRWLPWLGGAAQALAAMVVFTAAVIVAHLIPGALGLLVPGAVLVAAGLLTLCVHRVSARSRTFAATEPPHGVRMEPADPRLSWLLAAGAGLLLAGCALALVRDLAGAPVTSIDAQNFQVPIVARWIQGESLWGLHQFIADYSNATYPQNGNLLVAAVMLPFESPFLARLVAVPYWAMAAIGVYAIAREIGAPRPGSVLAAAAFAAVPVMVRAGLEGVQTDAPMLGCLAAGVLFLLRHDRTGERRELIVAAVALGLAFGTKWYAVTAVAAIIVLWALARRRIWPDAAVVVSLVAAAGGFWLLRNLVDAGNPTFPQPLGPFSAPRDTLRELGGFTLAHYLFDFDVWKTYLRPAFASTFGWTGAILAAGAVVAAALRPHGRVLVVLAGTVALTALYLVTPYSAFGPEGRPVLAAASTRYGLPALMGAAVLCAWATRRRGVRPVLEVLLAAGVVDGVRRAFGDLSAAKMAGGIVVAAAAWWVVPRVRPRRLLAVAVAVLGVLFVVGVAHRANRTGYAQFDPTLAWIEAHAPSGSRIGLAGVWSTDGVSPVLAAFGPRLGNRVEFVGEFRDHMLRAFTAPGRFTAGLRGEDLLIVGRGNPPGPAAPEETWALAAGWRPVAASPRLVLLRRP